MGTGKYDPESADRPCRNLCYFHRRSLWSKAWGRNAVWSFGRIYKPADLQRRFLSVCGDVYPLVERHIARCDHAFRAPLYLMHVSGHCHICSHTFPHAPCAKIPVICFAAGLLLCNDQRQKWEIYYRNDNLGLCNANPVHHAESGGKRCGCTKHGARNQRAGVAR